MVSLRDLENRFDKASDELAACPTLRNASGLSDIDFHHLLIQRRFVSLAFTPFYDMIIDALDDGEARLICRQILREEYPDEGGNMPSHREQLVSDLVTLGIEKTRILLSHPTRATAESIVQSFGLIGSACAEQQSEVALIATAACYAEALVCAEYQALGPRIEQVRPLATTAFFSRHLLHDAGHTRRLLEEVRDTVDLHPGLLQTLDATLVRCVQVKMTFYQQFDVGVAL